MQQTRRSIAYVVLVIFVVLLPTVVSLSWYYVTLNPNLRPLGVTREALRAYGEAGAGVEAVAYVDWVPPRTGGFTQAQLTSDLRDSFAAKGVDIRIVIRAGNGSTQITYVVGRSVLGPFPAARAAEGVTAAVEAYRMY